MATTTTTTLPTTTVNPWGVRLDTLTPGARALPFMGRSRLTITHVVERDGEIRVYGTKGPSFAPGRECWIPFRDVRNVA